MKKVESLQELKNETAQNENVWLLLYKKGSVQSDCAFENYQKAEKMAEGEDNNTIFYAADVAQVRDIHPEYDVINRNNLMLFLTNRQYWFLPTEKRRYKRM
jgi:hypothetical protein